MVINITSSFTVYIQILAMLYIAILNLVINKRKIRKLVIFYTLLLNLGLNSILFIFNISSLFKSTSIFSLSNGAFIIIELIYLLGLFLSIFSRSESKEYPSEKIVDCFILIIISSLIGLVISINLISFISCFLIAILSIGIIFFLADYKKEFNLLKLYFIGCIFTIACLVLLIIIIFLETNTLLLYELNNVEFSSITNTLLSLIFIIGIGIPFGMFPFFIYHLRDYFQNTSYTYLFLYSLVNYITTFSTLKIFQIFTFTLVFNGFLLFFLSSLSLLISLFYIITELFTSLDGNSYSLKKLFGYSVVSDFNIFILFSSFISLINSGDISFYVESLVFFLLIIMSNKFLIYYTFFPLMLETYDDNLKLFGNFRTKYKIFGRFLFVSGIILVFPLSFNGSFNILYLYNLDEVMINSLLKLMATLAFSLFIIYLSINLIFISIIYIQIYYSQNPEYQEREDLEGIRTFYLFPIPVLLALISTFIILFYFGNNIIFEWFKDFLLLSGL
jgi:formate hydrogenlyase subunit 3/multisubunit Na+/H+ antiporter MnhD subunit